MDHLNNLTSTAVENPWTTAKYTAYGASFFCPIPVLAPVLGAGGVAAGTLAATIQSFLPPVVAHGAFATVQSAMMGGYGVPIVTNVARIVTAAGAVTDWTLGEDGDLTPEENEELSRQLQENHEEAGETKRRTY